MQGDLEREATSYSYDLRAWLPIQCLQQHFGQAPARRKEKVELEGVSMPRINHSAWRYCPLPDTKEPLNKLVIVEAHDWMGPSTEWPQSPLDAVSEVVPKPVDTRLLVRS